METPMDFEQVILASYSVQQKSVTPGNCYLLYQKAVSPEDNEIIFVDEESSVTKSNREIESALAADSSSA
jgi:CDP-glycerol glycerophosphotransferase (TagB/SpsB family)